MSITKQKAKCPTHNDCEFEGAVNIDSLFTGQRVYCSSCLIQAQRSGVQLKNIVTFREVIIYQIQVMDDYMNLADKSIEANMYLAYNQLQNNILTEIDQVYNKVTQVIDSLKQSTINTIEAMGVFLKQQVQIQKEENRIIIEKRIGYSQLKEYYLNAPFDVNVNNSEQWKQFFNQLDITVKHMNSKEILDLKILSQELQKQSHICIKYIFIIIKIRSQVHEDFSNYYDQITQESFQYMIQLSNKLQIPVTIQYKNQLFEILKSQTNFYNTLLSKLNFKDTFSLLYNSQLQTKDYDTFVSKVNGKNELLMILKVETGEIVGAYIPQTYDSTKDYIADNTCKSFIFSVLKQQIYPLKEAHKAQGLWCSGYLAWIGYDLSLSQSFQATSVINSYYDASMYGSIDKSTHLLNTNTSTTVIMLEVYQCQ